ncbi:MAG TPA: LysM peptidoglycan-binding domain-containing protein [Anaerolineales bacterium]|nr:LysM peptidoglycan-binding domain-containing protein [Anaerolineales bacterium]HMR98155.1 LysM peptidoglycan-binding domain-containing protein [Anaerolineales bacterium]HNQ94027.1 LysM peptidoglycan-binding domain-containing protein [Anaerolineales bacterium]HNS60569.1 LysM peptidoglycan-binding domain-containing protein [Anaerolineales bacterium]
MRITHDDARKLIEFSLDDSISPENRAILAGHLATCNPCQTYTREVKDVESALRMSMKKHWAVKPLPLSLDHIRGGASKRDFKVPVLATRLAMLGMFFTVIALSIWQFSKPNRHEGATLPVAILPNPTPSLQATSTNGSLQECQNIVYKTQPSDTLENIAQRFAVDEESILEANNLQEATVHPDMELTIPVCASTPTFTAYPPTITTTFTPLMQLTTYTPNQ